MTTHFPAARLNALLWLLVIGLTLLVLHNAAYTHPMADDYCFADKLSVNHTWIKTVAYEYQTWGGRYATTAIISLFIEYFDLVKDFWVIGVSLILISAGSLYFFFSAFMFVGCEPKDWRLWFAFAWCFYLASMSAMPEVFYWLSGGVTYAGGYSWLLIVLGLLLRLSFAEYSSIKFYGLAVLCLVLITLTPGFNEVAAVLQAVVLLFGILFVRKKHRRLVALYVVGLILATAALGVSALAPGNAARMAVLESHSNKWLTPFYGLYQGLGVMLAASVLMYLLTSNNVVMPTVQRMAKLWQEKIANFSPLDKVMAVLFVVALFSAVFMPSYWAEGGSPAKRTETILFLLPALIWIPLVAFVNHNSRMVFLRYPWMTRYNMLSNIISCTLIGLLMVLLNPKDVVKDAMGRAADYDQQLLSRYKMIEAARKDANMNLVVPALSVQPASLFFADILPDASHWRNTCYAQYFQLDSIKLNGIRVDSVSASPR